MALSLISVDEKLVRMVLDTSPSSLEPTVILVVTKIIQQKVIEAIEGKPEKKSIYVTNGRIGGKSVSVVRTHLGEPGTAMAIECLKRCGVKTIIRFEFCGWINQEIHVGDIYVPKSATLIDGTARDYYQENQSKLQDHPLIWNIVETPQCFCSKPLIEKLSSIQNQPTLKIGGFIITTDTLFLETEEKIQKWQSLGAKAVDMESSVVFLLATLFEIQSVSILVVSDEPGSDNYDMLKTNKLYEGIEGSIKNGLDIVKSLLRKI